MLSKAKIKLINSLTNKKYRQQHGLFMVEGSNNVIDFLQSGLETIEIFATNNWISAHIDLISDHKREPITEAEMKKITALTTPSEVLALFSLPNQKSLPSSQLRTLTLMLDDIKDPGNLGTIIRTADWFGIRHIICSNSTTDTFSPKVVQASMGSLSRVNIQYTELKPFLTSLKQDVPVYGALLEGKSIHNISHSGPGIILIGSEAHGINPDLFSHINQKITIPAGRPSESGKAESLNASIATAIICYQLTKAQ
jgi:TrmH family RNA methyltransferase